MFGIGRQAKINEYNRQQILERIAMITRGCTTQSSMNVLAELNKVRDTLNMQPAASSKEAYECDAKIRNYLMAIQNDIVNQSWNVADIRIEKIKQVLGERATLCVTTSDALLTRQEKRMKKRAEKEFAKWQRKNKLEDFASALSVDDLYKDDELYQLNVARLQDAVQREIEKRSELEKKLERDPYNESIISNLEVLEDKIAGLQETLNVYTDERKRASYVASLRQAPAARKQAIAQRTFSDEEAQYIMNEHDVMINEMNNDFVLQARAQGRGTARTTRTSATTQTTSTVGVGATRQTAGSASERLRAQRELDEIRKLYDQLEQKDESFIQQLQDLDQNLREVDLQLRPLLELRKQLTPAQRMTTDGQIDSLIAKRTIIENSISRINQEKSVNLDALNVIASKKQIMELLKGNNVANVNIEEIQQTAMDVMEATKEGNRKLDAARAAAAVAQSEEIRSGSMSGIMHSESQTVDAYGDDKYEVYEKAIGMTK